MDMLVEMARVLKRGGVLNIVVPHAHSLMAEQDLDHKSRFVLDTWKHITQRGFYSKGKIDPTLFVHFNATMAVAERNTAILTQMVKL